MNLQEHIRKVLRENKNVKLYLLRRYDYGELNDILQKILQTQSRNLKHYKDKSLNHFNNAVVRSITEKIGEELTDGWIQDLPIPENEIYDFVESLFKDKITKKYGDLVLNNIDLQKKIRKVLREEKLHATPQELIRNLPDELKKLLFSQWSAKQNPKWHPEGNTLKHILVVIKRAYHHYPDDPNMVMAALFHDLGKMDTYEINPKTNQPTAYGHEDKSTDYVEQYRNWIESFEGTDVDEIKYLVKNHMKVKPSTWDQMKDKKKEPIKSHPAFDKLMGFTDKLDGGGTHLKEHIRKVLREEINQDNLKKLLFKILSQSEYVQKFDYIWSPNLSVGMPIVFINNLSEKDFFNEDIDTIELISEYWPYGQEDYKNWKNLYYGLVYGYSIKDKNSDVNIVVQIIRFEDGYEIYINPEYRGKIEGDKFFMDEEMINVFKPSEKVYSDNNFSILGKKMMTYVNNIDDVKKIFYYLDAIL